MRLRRKRADRWIEEYESGLRSRAGCPEIRASGKEVHTMAGQGKIKEELLSELAQLRRQITRLQHAETERRQVKIALRESEDKYESIARAAIEGIYHADGEGRFVFVNDACTRILGYDRDELLGKHYSIIIPEAGIPMATEITRAAAQGDPQKGEFILKHKQGHGVPVHFSMVALGSPGERAGLTGIIQDITERKRAEEALQKARDELEMRVAERTMELELANEELRAEMVEREDAERALRESEEKYRNVVERANDMVAIVQDNLIKFVNQRVVDMAGYAPEEVICTALSQHIAPEERPVVMERYARRVAGEDVPPRYETTLFRKDGTTVDVEINAGVIMYEGRPADLVIVRDITERKKAEKALRESEERFRALIENAFEGIAILNADGIAVYASPAIERIAGIPSEEAVGKRLIELVHPDDRARFQENFTLAMREPGALVTGTYRALYANGRWHVV
ncbi:MAG: PAS domain S-box protein, partial [Chloroflexi bacterium]|nr:PAS domain S-box protein [Chloroflexota bacterium]